MKTYHVLQATLTLTTCTLSALAISTSANASTVVTFDDLTGDNLLVPDGYGGIRWDNNWIYSVSSKIHTLLSQFRTESMGTMTSGMVQAAFHSTLHHP